MSDKYLPRRPNRALLLGALAIAFLAAASPADACDARLGALQADAIAYDPFSSAVIEGAVRLQVELTEGDTCDVVVSLTDESGAQLRSLRFGNDDGVTFRPELRQQGIVGAATDPADAIVHLTSASPRAQIEWRLLSTSDAVIAPGDYTKQVEGRLRVSDGVPGPPSRGAVVLRSIARAQANLAGTAGKFASGSDAATIDLGELATGKSGRAYLQVRANTLAHVSFRSANLGWLVNDRAPNARVRYAMTLAGRPVDLAATTVQTLDAPRSIDGDAFSIDVTVGDVGGANAGRYSDTVTIDISP